MFLTNHVSEDVYPADEAKLRGISEKMLQAYDCEGAEFSLAFISPEEIQSLNKQFRDVDAVTDVLTFCSGGEVDPESGRLYLGDILICESRAKEQAEFSGHSLENEVYLLLIHGILHLMDFDHDTDENKEEMWREQNYFLDEFQVALNRRPGEDFDF